MGEGLGAAGSLIWRLGASEVCAAEGGDLIGECGGFSVVEEAVAVDGGEEEAEALVVGEVGDDGAGVGGLGGGR